MNLEQFITEQGQPVDVTIVGSKPANERAFFSKIRQIGALVNQHGSKFAIAAGVATTMAFAAPSAHALTEFNPGAAFQSLAAYVTPSSTTAEQSKTAAMPTFKDAKEVEAYYLSEDGGNNYFVALATRMEGLVTTVYDDPARGRNIGVGYNMDEIGLDQAKRDFVKIGMKKDQIDILMKKDSANYNKVKITTNQAVQLLINVQSRYENAAAKWIGNDFWEKMPSNQQASLSYLAYQTGGKIEQFKKAKHHIREGNDDRAQKNLVTYYQDRKGAWQKNERFEKHVGNMWQSPEKYAAAAGVKPIQSMGIEGSTERTQNSSFVDRISAQQPQDIMNDMGNKIRSGLRIFSDEEAQQPVKKSPRM